VDLTPGQKREYGDIETQVKRFAARGQRQPLRKEEREILMINLIARNTIEHGMLETLALKQGLADGVLDGIGKLSEVQLKKGPPRKRTSTDPGADFTNSIRELLKDKLVSCEEQFITDTEAPPKFVVILENDTPQTRETIVKHLIEAIPHLQEISPDVINERLVTMDANTAAALEQMQRPASLHEGLVRKLKTVGLLLPAGLHQEAAPAITSALMIKALETRAPGPTSEAELANPGFSYLHAEPGSVKKFLTDPGAVLAEKLFQSL
jgi:hypothetical protein